jgi:hypothetical protein
MDAPEYASDVPEPSFLKGLRVMDCRSGKLGLVVDVLPSLSMEVHWDKGGFQFVPKEEFVSLKIQW